jgi:hypothetical protein
VISINRDLFTAKKFMGLVANGSDGSRTPFATPEYLMRAYLGVLQEGEVRGAWLLSLLSLWRRGETHIEHPIFVNPKRMPAKTALLIAGTIAEVPASAMPPDDSRFCTMWILIVGARPSAGFGSYRSWFAQHCRV